MSTAIHSVELNILGRPLYPENVPKEKVDCNYENTSKLNHDYYRNQMNDTFGPAGIVGFFGTLVAGIILLYEKGPAALTNFFVTFAEYLQVHLTRSRILGNPDIEGEKGEVAKQRREGAIAWIQKFAGIGGIVSLILEKVQHKEEDELPFYKKALLSALSIIGTGLMFFSYGEKSVLAATSKGNKQGNESQGMRLNANSDIRGAISWLIMAIYPFVTQIKSIKTGIDLALPYLAMRDSVEHFMNHGVSKVVTNAPNIQLSNKVKNILKYPFLIFKGNEKQEFEIPAVFAKNWFLANDGIREKYLVPFFKVLGCVPPHYDLIYDVSGKQKIRMYYDQFELEKAGMPKEASYLPVQCSIPANS